MKYKTKKEAAEAWVGEFNAFPTEMIRELMTNRPDDWCEITIADEEDESYCEDYMPMWGTMWQFGDWCDREWFTYGNALESLSSCGFRVYESEDYGYFFGIEGAGYDFYEVHWIPLYEKRGLKWHKEEEA